MIGLSKRTQDAAGAIIIDETNQSKIYDVRARISRAETLDGGVVIDHLGVVDGDRTILIKCVVSAADEDIIRSLCENETLINITISDGAYTGAIESLSGDDGNLALSIFLKESA